MKLKISRASLLVLCITSFLPRAAIAQAEDKTAGPKDRPNVLFIIVDDLNVAIGSYLDTATHPQYATASTPNIDRLAAQGVRFERTYVQNPICNPSRASMLSGLRPASTGIHIGGGWPRAVVGDELRMLPEHFHDQGYFTARVGKISHNTSERSISWDVSEFAKSREPGKKNHSPGYLPGIDLSEVRDNTWTDGSEDGMSRRDVLVPLGRRGNLPLSWRATEESPEETPDGSTATRIIELLAEKRDKPFFIAAGFHKPHQPWVGPAQFFEPHSVDEIQLPNTPPDDLDDVPDPAFWIMKDDPNLSERQKKQAIAAYHAMVTMVDSYVGQLLDALERLELDDSTIVVFTSDHGFQLNEHGGLWRKIFQFEESTRVPLIVRLPNGQNAGQVATGFVELVDLYPTLIDLAKLPNPAHALEGTSFKPLLEEPGKGWKSAAFSESRREGYHGSTLREKRYRYTEWVPLPGTDGETLRELYDLEKDPFEYDNLAANETYDAVVAELSRRLEAGWQAARP